MKKVLLGLLVLAVVWAGAGIRKAEPAEAAEPITASAIAVGIGVGLAANLLTDLTKSVVGDTENARVQCDAETTGPKNHINLGQDRAIHPGDFDTDKFWDTDLEASVSLAGPNHGKSNHIAFGSIKYHYVSEGGTKGWRPKTTTGTLSTGEKFPVPAANRLVKAQPDGDPTPGQDNITAAAAVCAFGLHGKISKEDTFSWSDQNPKKVKQSKTSDSKQSQAESQSSLHFSAGRFSFQELPNGKVRVSPIGEVEDIELFHTSLMVGDKPALLHQPFAGLGGLTDELASDIFQDIADNSNGIAEYDPDKSKQADLTLTGAAVNLGIGEYDLFDTNGIEKSRRDLLAEYLGDTSAVQIIAPAQAQEGYSPNVTCREVVVGTKRASCPNISDELRSTITPLSLETIAKDAPEETGVGIVIAAHGTLEDALTLAANTPGTEVANIVNSVAEGDLFGLEFIYSQSDVNLADSVANNRIDCPVLVFNPITETYEDLCDDNTENVFPSDGTPVEDDHDHGLTIDGTKTIDGSAGTGIELITPVTTISGDGLIINPDSIVGNADSGAGLVLTPIDATKQIPTQIAPLDNGEGVDSPGVVSPLQINKSLILN